MAKKKQTVRVVFEYKVETGPDGEAQPTNRLAPSSARANRVSARSFTVFLPPPRARTGRCPRR